MTYVQENFHKWVPEIGKYHNGRTCLSYVSYDEDMGMSQQECVASINLPNVDVDMNANDIIGVKTYSENEGLLEMMIAAKHVSKPLVWIEQGFVKIPICRLLIKQEPGV